MINKRRKIFPEFYNNNRYYFPMQSRKNFIGISPTQGIDPCEINDNSLYEATDPEGSYTGVTSDGLPPTQDADDL